MLASGRGTEIYVGVLRWGLPRRGQKKSTCRNRRIESMNNRPKELPVLAINRGAGQGQARTLILFI